MPFKKRAKKEICDEEEIIVRRGTDTTDSDATDDADWEKKDEAARQNKAENAAIALLAASKHKKVMSASKRQAGALKIADSKKGKVLPYCVAGDEAPPGSSFQGCGATKMRRNELNY